MNELNNYKTEAAMVHIQKVLSTNGAVSFFVPIVINGNKVDTAFIYSATPQIEKGRPYAKLIINPASGILLDYRNAYVCEIAEFAEFDHTEKISYAVPYAKTAKEQGLFIATVKRLYPEIREFAFEKALTNEQKLIAKEYYDAFVKATPNLLMPYYEAIAPDFMEWLNTITQ